MSVTALLELRLKPDSLDASYSLLDRILVDTRAFPGNEGIEVLIDTADPAHVIVKEAWASLEADSAYRVWRASEAGASDLGSVLAGPPVLTVLSTGSLT